VEFSAKGTNTSIVDSRGSIVCSDYYKLDIFRPKIGWEDRNPAELYQSAIFTIKNSLKKFKGSPEDVKALIFTSQMAGILGINKKWDAVTTYDSWTNIRCKKYAHLLHNRYEDLLIEKVGAPPSISHGPKILWWKNERKETYEKIFKFITPNSYVAGKMAGLKGNEAFIDYTFLNFTGFSDTRKMAWSEEICQLLDVSVDKFPKIVKPWEIIGELSTKESRKLGLAEGVPILAGAGNLVVSSLGAGIINRGMILDSAGIASVFSCATDEYVPDRRFRTFILLPSVITGLWLPMAYVGGGGLCLRWFIEELVPIDGKPLKRNRLFHFDLNHAQMEEDGRKIPRGSEGLFFIPHFRGRLYPFNPTIKGAWIGLDWRHTKAHMYRSILESIAYEYLYYKSVLGKLYPKLNFREARVIGEGASIDLWNQIKSEVLGIPYVRVPHSDVRPIGLMLIAEYGLRLIKDLKKAAEKVNDKKIIVKPTRIQNYRYKRLAKKYFKLLTAVEYLYKEVNLNE
jgi:xylulokinase